MRAQYGAGVIINPHTLLILSAILARSIRAHRGSGGARASRVTLSRKRGEGIRLTVPYIGGAAPLLTATRPVSSVPSGSFLAPPTKILAPGFMSLASPGA